MDTVRTILAHRYPYPHEHSRHAVFAVFIGSVFFISTDNMHTLLFKLDKNIKWWSIYGCLLGFFYFFSSPFYGKTIQPSYSNFSRWYVAWLLVAACYHLPSFQSMGVDLRMNLSLFLTLFISSVFALVTFHITFLGLWYFGLVARLAGKRPEILTILQNSMVLSIACCVFYSHCGNRAPSRAQSLGRQRSSQIIFDYFKNSNTTWLMGWPTIHEAKEQICSTWLGPVGSASDYPFFSKWVVYGELACSEGCGASDNMISPVYSLWATFIGLYIANYVVERSTGWALTHPQLITDRKQQPAVTQSPDFLDMVPWYSGTSADLLKTAFDLIISVTLFLGRFDMRTMQAAMAKDQPSSKKDEFLYNHLSKREELWFDFMADTGDGGNSTYTVARLLAQPQLKVLSQDSHWKTLKRGTLLLIGGDLAYPNPSPFSYGNRLFRPFEYALQPPSFYKEAHIAVKKPELPNGVKSLADYEGPQCFAIPGNHDWFDGLETFVRYILHKSWLGGWLLPQKKSYFALQLPHGWWVFGLDQALYGDIDILQFRYFSELIRKQVKKKDSVIIMTHEPSWLLDWYWHNTTGVNVSILIQDLLKGRCRLRVAGDLHHYFRHSVNKPSKGVNVEHLLVNGCGGAFLHPTHVFAKFDKFMECPYETKAAYPSFSDSKRMALGNILKFRKKNWRFDVIGGFVYFILVLSSFPQCHLDNILQENTFYGHIQEFLSTLWIAFVNMLEHSYVSLGGTLILLIFSYSFVPAKISKKRRAFLGFLHVSAHLTAAMVLMLLMEIGTEICIRHGLLGASGYHTLYEWYRSVENEHFPDPTGLKARMEYWTLGLYPACIKYLMSAFDVPEVMAVTRIDICRQGMAALPRGYIFVYFIGIFLYYWVFSTPVVSLVFGCYLYICINWFHLHFDEAFSSLRIANYKSFTRFHITTAGNLEVYSIAVDKVPKEWVLDRRWEEEEIVDSPSHARMNPSRWSPKWPFPDPNINARIIDHFVIEKLS